MRERESASPAGAAGKAPALRVAGVSKRFGGLQALSDVGITIRTGEVYGLIGPNGAGKTTFFNVLTGLYEPDSGTFELAGKPYRPNAVHEVAKSGIARTFQNIRLFSDMTALENVMVGRHVRTHSGLVGAIFRTAAFKAEEAAIAARAQELLEYVGIGGFAEYKARTLSYGDQRRLEVARALATDPKLIALDEPAAGWVPVMAFSVVVLPAPLAPMRLTSSPFITSKDTPFTAWMPPYATRKSLTRSKGGRAWELRAFPLRGGGPGWGWALLRPTGLPRAFVRGRPRSPSRSSALRPACLRRSACRNRAP